MLVGEQPGDAEDLAGHPFVGPAGRCSIARSRRPASIGGTVYLTNVVKHFKWEPRGKRRIHAKPNAAEIGACRPWLETEIALVKPRVLVCLGATAAQALARQVVQGVAAARASSSSRPLAPIVTATVHPSSILRAPDDEARREEMRRFVADLKKVAAMSSGRENRIMTDTFQSHAAAVDAAAPGSELRPDASCCCATFVPDGAFGLVLNRPTELAASAMVRLDPPVEHGNDLPLFTSADRSSPTADGFWSGTSHPTRNTGRSWTVSTCPRLRVLLRRVLESRPAPRALRARGLRGLGPRSARRRTGAVRVAHGRHRARPRVRHGSVADVGDRDPPDGRGSVGACRRATACTERAPSIAIRCLPDIGTTIA